MPLLWSYDVIEGGQNQIWRGEYLFKLQSQWQFNKPEGMPRVVEQLIDKSNYYVWVVPILNLTLDKSVFRNKISCIRTNNLPINSQAS